MFAFIQMPNDSHISQAQPQHVFQIAELLAPPRALSTVVGRLTAVSNRSISSLSSCHFNVGLHLTCICRPPFCTSACTQGMLPGCLMKGPGTATGRTTANPTSTRLKSNRQPQHPRQYSTAYSKQLCVQLGLSARRGEAWIVAQVEQYLTTL